jgi:hypothetical protein
MPAEKYIQAIQNIPHTHILKNKLLNNWVHVINFLMLISRAILPIFTLKDIGINLCF